MKTNLTQPGETTVNANEKADSESVQESVEFSHPLNRLSKWTSILDRWVLKCEAKKRILIVDDEALFRDTLGAILTSEGYEVMAAASADEAMRLLEVSRPDVMLLDVELPDENGLEFLKRLRTGHPGLPVVMLTGLGYEDNLMRTALEGRADAYISKGVAVQNLLATLRRLLSPGQNSGPQPIASN